MSTIPKAAKLRDSSKADILKELDTLKKELATLRVNKVSGGAASKLAKIKAVRKSIAMVQTVHNQMQRQEVRKFYQGKKYKPIDLRPKKTRAIRRRLTPHEASRKTLRLRKREIHFPQRVFAVKASA
eukprot:m.319541 g.319541  ORF g.319541 m.319541 type:complete len:127 (+) comp23215_c0_seq1:70-450(+)